MLRRVDQYTLKKCEIVFYYENTPYETTVTNHFKVPRGVESVKNVIKLIIFLNQ